MHLKCIFNKRAYLHPIDIQYVFYSFVVPGDGSILEPRPIARIPLEVACVCVCVCVCVIGN